MTRIIYTRAFRESISLLVLCLASIALHALLSRRIPHAYMDEIFHVPQLRRYCACEDSLPKCLINTHWDPKITTPPALYFLTWPYCALLRALQTDKDCSTSVPAVRAFNVLLHIMLSASVLLHFVPSQLRMTRHTSLLRALQQVLFPLVYFYAFLYYTDLVSLITFLGMLHRRSPLLAAVCVLTRQTNIVWVFFAAALMVLRDSNKHDHIARPSSNLFTQISSFTAYCVTRLPYILIDYFAWIFIAVLFVAFVFINGSIALGDKSNHVPTVHVPQLFYFWVFACLMLPGHVLSILLDLPRTLRSRYTTTNSSKMSKNGQLVVTTQLNVRRITADVVAFSLASLVVAYLSYRFAFVHPFILSDNRHYIFYLWRRIFKVHHVHTEEYRVRNALLAPVYVSAALVLNTLLSSKQVLWRGIFWFCVALSLIPSPLVEFRYFIIPFYVLLESIELRASKRRQQIANAINLLWYILINVVTLYVFVCRPFGADLESRFMW